MNDGSLASQQHPFVYPSSEHIGSFVVWKNKIIKINRTPTPIPPLVSLYTNESNHKEMFDFRTYFQVLTNPAAVLSYQNVCI